MCRQKTGFDIGKKKRGKDTKIMDIADAAGFPIAARVESASPHEVKLVAATIDSGFTQYEIDRLVDNKAYDSDGLDAQLVEDRKIE